MYIVVLVDVVFPFQMFRLESPTSCLTNNPICGGGVTDLFIVMSGKILIMAFNVKSPVSRKCDSAVK